MTKRRISLLRLGFSLDPKVPSMVDFEMDEKEFGVIGYALVHWSFMEHALLKSTAGLAEAIQVAVPRDAKQDSFRRRLNAFQFLTAKVEAEDLRRPLEDLAARIAKENGFRQKLARGIWHYDAADPDILHVEVSRQNDNGPTEFFNRVKIFEFARRVGQISFELLHPGGYTLAEFAADDSGESSSRSFARSMTGKSIVD